MSPYKLKTAEMYQLVLQLVCIIDGWSEKIRHRRPDIERDFQVTLSSLLTTLSKAQQIHRHVERDMHLTRTHDRLHHLAALIDMAGALHLMAPNHIRSARDMLNRLTQRCVEPRPNGDPSPPEREDYPVCS